jgi:flagellar FliL protein
MAENHDELDLEGSDSGAGEAAPKKPSGLATLLPTILKFALIGLGALVFIVTVSLITYRIASGGGQNQSVQQATEEYQGKRPELDWSDNVGVVRTRTNDPTPFSVVVHIVLGYDLGNKAAQSELVARNFELKDFVRSFFSSKTAAELKIENQPALKLEIRELLNTRLLQDTRIREVLFEQLDVVEM